MDTAFKLFDIRGKFPEEVDQRLAFAIGKALTLWKKPQKVLLAGDLRKSTKILKSFLADGLGETQIYDLGVAPISQFYYSVATNDFDLGIMVTASHLGSEENGFKLANKAGLPFDSQEILTLKQKVTERVADKIIVPHAKVCGFNNFSKYIDDVLKFVGQINFNKKIILDFSNSTVTDLVIEIFNKYNLRFDLVDRGETGSPILAQNQKKLAKKILESKAELGIKWDSDGDRVVFLDHNGQMISGSFALGILGMQEEGKIAVDVRAGLIIQDLIKDFVVLPAWGQYIKFAMEKDEKIVFGGETSGHYIYRDFYKIDDGIVAALKFLKVYQRGLLENLAKKYFELPEKNFSCNLTKVPVILNTLANFYRKANYIVSVEDGLTVFGGDFKFNLRASLTEDLLRLNLETKSQSQANEVIHELEKHL